MVALLFSSSTEILASMLVSKNCSNAALCAVTQTLRVDSQLVASPNLELGQNVPATAHEVRCTPSAPSSCTPVLKLAARPGRKFLSISSLRIAPPSTPSLQPVVVS